MTHRVPYLYTFILKSHEIIIRMSIFFQARFIFHLSSAESDIEILFVFLWKLVACKLSAVSEISEKQGAPAIDLQLLFHPSFDPSQIDF